MSSPLSDRPEAVRAAERYRVALPDVLHQNVDGEIMLIHRARGSYHSLRGSGPLLFTPLLGGATERELVAVLAAETDADHAVIDAAVARILDDLWRDGIIVVAGDRGPEDPAGGPEARATSVREAGARAPFEPPSLETFTDLQDLLTADPVHDVGPRGWPNVASQRP